ncbi:hypothetical protein BC628DRAFT_1335978 [Trametes gibbosa]|nr:hypothetical protein BC628DRAFT_1335978 [Trametes gibbosa]
MHAKIFAAFLLSAFVAQALPAKRDNRDSGSADNASLYQSQAKDLLSAVNSEISAAGPSGSAFTAYITTVAGRPVVEMSSIHGEVWVAMTSSAAATATARPNVDAAASDTSSSDAANSTSSSASPQSSSSSSGSAASQTASPTGSPNSASGLQVSRYLLTGVVGALGAVGAGALMIL